jgi:tripartite-type tricarboxylate transporter receptor subunit TctC
MAKVLSWVVIVLVFGTISGELLAQDKYPERPITAIINFPPGSPNEISARAMGNAFPKYIGQPLVVVSKVGAGGFVAGAAVASSKPDGYTIGVLTNQAASPNFMAKIMPTTYKDSDLVPIAGISGYVIILCCHKDAPYKTFNEFVHYARKSPTKLKFGSIGKGTRYWMLGLALAKEAGFELNDIPFNGEIEYRTALLGKHIDVALMTYGAGTREYVQSGDIRVLCTFEAKRLEELPNVPTTTEVGYAHKYSPLFIGAFVPKGTPERIIAKLSTAIEKTMGDAEFKAQMQKVYLPIRYMDMKAFQATIKNDVETTEKFLKEQGVL